MPKSRSTDQILSEGSIRLINVVSSLKLAINDVEIFTC